MSVITQVIYILRHESYLDEAIELEHMAVLLESDDEEQRTRAVKAIRGMCQVRAFGDLNISSMNGWKWNELLEKASKFAQRKL